MAVELAEYVEALRAKVNPPGEDLYPDAVPDDWVLRLRNAFWDGYLHKMFADYIEAEGTVRHRTTATTNMPRDQLQLVILYAALDALLAKFVDLKTAFRGKAGPTEFEYQRSAGVLVALIKDRRTELSEVTAEVKRKGVTATYYLDAVSRRLGLEDGGVGWVR